MLRQIEDICNLSFVFFDNFFDAGYITNARNFVRIFDNYKDYHQLLEKMRHFIERNHRRRNF